MMNADKLEKGETMPADIQDFSQNKDETQHTVEIQDFARNKDDETQHQNRRCALISACSVVSFLLFLGLLYLIYWLVWGSSTTYQGTDICKGCVRYVNGQSFEAVSVNSPAQVRIMWGDTYDVSNPQWYWPFQEGSTIHVYENQKLWKENGYGVAPNYEHPTFVDSNVTIPLNATITHLSAGGSGGLRIVDFPGGDLTAKGENSGSVHIEGGAIDKFSGLGSNSGGVTLVNVTVGDFSAKGENSGEVHMEGGSIEQFSGHGHGSGSVELVNVKVGCIKESSEGGSGWVRFKDENGEEIDRSTIPKC